MRSFPLFLSLQGRRALVVGGNERAMSKVDLLVAAGADVEVIDDGRPFEERDLTGVALAIVATDDEALQARVSQAAQARGVPVNVIDRPALSSFIMPAIVDRGPVTVAISTGGAAPALARKLRAEIERALPPAIGRLARFAEIFRVQVRRTLAEPRARRLFWDRVFDGSVGRLALAGDETAARRALIRLLDTTRRANPLTPGMVHLVGAGPGDPDLLTLKAHRLLQRADVIVHDRLLSPAILRMARRDAERIVALPIEIPERLIALACAGKNVVRLAGTVSPTEAQALEAAGISVELVPGVGPTKEREFRFESGIGL